MCLLSDEDDGGSLVQTNLMERPGYTPYCGADRCAHRWPRLRWNGAQFACGCGYITNFPAAFIERYKNRWAKP